MAVIASLNQIKDLNPVFFEELFIKFDEDCSGTLTRYEFLVGIMEELAFEKTQPLRDLILVLEEKARPRCDATLGCVSAEAWEASGRS